MHKYEQIFYALFPSKSFDVNPSVGLNPTASAKTLGNAEFPRVFSLLDIKFRLRQKPKWCPWCPVCGAQALNTIRRK